MSQPAETLEQWTRRLVECPTYRRDGSRDDEAFLSATRQALEWLEEWGEERGIATYNWKNRVLEMTVGTGDPVTGLVAHVDVVPPGDESWEQEDPFTVQADQLNGRRLLRGRGVVDDKGPLAALMWVVERMGEGDVSTPGGVRLIVDTAEEVGFDNIRAYRDAHPERVPDRSVVSDGFFPLVAGEKGRLAFRVTLRSFEESLLGSRALTLVSLEGGRAVNQVPDRATAHVQVASPGSWPSEEELSSRLTDSIRERLTVHEREDGVRELVVRGDTAHAATPGDGYNAIAALLVVLSCLENGGDERNGLINRLSVLTDRTGDFRHDGEWVGLRARDARFREGTTVNLGLGRYNAETDSLTLDFDARMVPDQSPCEVLESTVKDRLTEAFGEAATVQVGSLGYEEPLLVDPECPLARGAREAYRDVKQRDADPVYMGGRTHATALPDAFTCGIMERDRFESYGFHGVDEQVYLDELVDAARIYVRLFERLSDGSS